MSHSELLLAEAQTRLVDIEYDDTGPGLDGELHDGQPDGTRADHQGILIAVNPSPIDRMAKPMPSVSTSAS